MVTASPQRNIVLEGQRLDNALLQFLNISFVLHEIANNQKLLLLHKKSVNWNKVVFYITL